YKPVLYAWWKYAAAILILLFSSSLIYYLSFSAKEEVLYTENQQEDIVPGDKEAWLVMSTGQRIRLNDYKEEVIEEKKGAKIKLEDSKLDYSTLREREKETDSLKEITHTLYTPKGGEYYIILEDGTQVWLNTETELTYPLVFGEEERKVFVKGEAYFEVEKDSKRPFVIVSEKATVKVLGTKFNVSSYQEDECNITLVEGKIEVFAIENEKSVILYPNQNLHITTEGKVTVEKEVNVEEFVGWKAGYFSFTETTLENIFKKLERWYNMEVVYAQEHIKEYSFTAWFNRSYPFEKVINQLEQTNKVEFEIEGKKIIVKDARKN
ncbi:MAG: FecR family protein, partial [Odoribacter sp.]|nr:FecR family protein [Odoribacter sp.]